MAKGSEVASRAFLKVTNKWSWWQNWVCLLWTKRSTVPASFVLWLEAGLSATNTHVALDWRLKVTHAQMVVFPSQPIIQSVKQSNSPENKHSLGVFPPVLHKQLCISGVEQAPYVRFLSRLWKYRAEENCEGFYTTKGMIDSKCKRGFSEADLWWPKHKTGPMHKTKEKHWIASGDVEMQTVVWSQETSCKYIISLGCEYLPFYSSGTGRSFWSCFFSWRV